MLSSFGVLLMMTTLRVQGPSLMDKVTPGEAYPPQEIARAIERLGVAKANADGATAVRSARMEAELPLVDAFTRGVLGNLLAVTAGYVVGGTQLVVGVYWAAYLRGERRGGEAC